MEGDMGKSTQRKESMYSQGRKDYLDTIKAIRYTGGQTMLSGMKVWIKGNIPRKFRSVWNAGWVSAAKGVLSGKKNKLKKKRLYLSLKKKLQPAR